MKINDQNLTQEYINDLRNIEQTYQTNNDGNFEKTKSEYLFMKSKMFFKASINDVFRFICEFIYKIIDKNSNGVIESVGLYKSSDSNNGYYVYKYEENSLIGVAYKVNHVYTVKEFHFKNKKNKTLVIKNEKCIYITDDKNVILDVDKAQMKKNHKIMTEKMIKEFCKNNNK